MDLRRRASGSTFHKASGPICMSCGQAVVGFWSKFPPGRKKRPPRAQPSTLSEAVVRGYLRSSFRTSALTDCTSTPMAQGFSQRTPTSMERRGSMSAGANDSFRITGMGFVYLEHALTIYNADALSIHDNFIAECGSCIELRGWGQASKVTDNLIGAGFKGHSIYAENHGGLLITANNIFPSCGQQRPSRWCHTLKRHQQPLSLVLLRHGCSRSEQFGESRGFESFSARS